MKRAHKIRLNPTPEQEQYFRQACGTARFVFNWGLAEWQRQYQAGQQPSCYRLKEQFNAIRREEYPWTYTVTKCAVDTGFANLHQAFQHFFRRVKLKKQGKHKGPLGYPRFKSRKRSKQSFRMDGVRVQVNGHWLKITRLATQINMTEKLRFEGRITSVTISEAAGYWYASINVEVEPPEHTHAKQAVGVDLGLKTLAVLSDGTRFENQELLRSELRKVKRLSRELARRQPGSGRWWRTKRRLARLHTRVKNRRLDYQHKMTTAIARRYQVVGVEDLNVRGMLQNHRLALSIADAGFGEIRRQVAYKAEWYGGVVVSVDQFFPSSKLCSACNTIKTNLTLSDRTFTCECGYQADRDLNAARNIEREALRVVAGVTSSTPETHVDGMQDLKFGAVPCEA